MIGEGFTSRLNWRPLGRSLLVIALMASEMFGATDADSLAANCVNPVYGALTCSTSSCHGGAAEKSRQYVIWSQRDVHSRSYATLGTARSARMAEALGIKDPLTDRRCTTCHAPIATVETGLVMPGAKASEGVSCVSCHGPLDGWLRNHTRSDYTHADRVAAGMRDLRDLNSRANACVACHQNIDPALVNVGRHPALTFELDGQTQEQPKHWREPEGRSGAQAWFVGQAVAWREMSWGLRQGHLDTQRELPRWRALGWLIHRAEFDRKPDGFGWESQEVTPTDLALAEEKARQLARRGADTWTPENTIRVLTKLAHTSADFRAVSPSLLQASRAERLVLAFDRLLAALPTDPRKPEASSQLDRLFRLAQSIPDFSPSDFARELDIFAQKLKPLLN